ncbi:MAG: HprK-related kinase B [Chromatiales bacterium]|jgi:HprK-related kinase B
MTTKHDINSLSRLLYGDARLTDTSLQLTLGQCHIQVRSNSDELIHQLQQYFSDFLDNDTREDIEVVAIERTELPPEDLPFEFIDWRREAGKSGRKDSYVDLPGLRLIRKVRTGMLFLQSADRRIAAGPCLQNDNQVINFINAQYMGWLQQRGWLTCHAAGLVRNGQALAIAGFSGGGKSTLMLHTLENPQINFLSNDRLFIQKHNGQTMASGVAKLPRVNPGTILHNPLLQPLIPAEQRAQLQILPTEELWHLEQKYDVIINQLYGPDRISLEAPLKAFVVLNWQRDSDQPTQLRPIDLAQRPDLLKAIMKSPGPFFQYADGRFYQDSTGFDEQAYLDMLSPVTVYEVSGNIDFTVMAQQLDKLTQNWSSQT